MTRRSNVTESSNPNIALIKYWGKSNNLANVPANRSLSITLSNFQTVTTVSPLSEDAFCPGQPYEDRFFLNEKETPIKERMRLIIEIFKTMAKDSSQICINSHNNFDHGCGLAASASGFSALVKALNTYYQLNIGDYELSIFARMGSGSASRSIYSGFVIFEGPGSKKIGDWPEITILCIILDGKQKKVSSTDGMMRTKETSRFYKDRLNRINKTIDKAIECVERRDFESLAEIIMRDSNEFHAICFETYPPIRYIKDEGFSVIEKCHEFNKNGNKVAYSFDAGTNPFLITLEEYVNEVKESFEAYEIVQCSKQ